VTKALFITAALALTLMMLLMASSVLVLLCPGISASLPL
jgi:hypothetical protein